MNSRYVRASLNSLILTIAACASAVNLQAHETSSSNKLELKNSDKPIHAQLSSSLVQIPDNTHTLVTLENIDELSGLKLVNNQKVIVKEPGTYFIMATGNIGTLIFSPPGYVDLWLNHNDQKISNSGMSKYVDQRFEKAPITTHTILTLKKGAQISVGFSATSPNLGLVASPSSDKEPAIPSISFSMFLLNK